MKIKLYLLFYLLFVLSACQYGENRPGGEDKTKPESLASRTSESSQEIRLIQSLSDWEFTSIEQEVPDESVNYESLADLVYATIESYNLPSDFLSIAIYDFMTGESFDLNADIAMHAASTNKVGTAILYADLIQAGILTLDSELYVCPEWVEDGNGDVTASGGDIYASIYDLIYQSLYYSDNTAWNTLINHYLRNYGDFQAALLALSGLAFDDPEVYNLNYGTARMLNEILYYLAINPDYQFILDIMLEAQEGLYLKMYVNEGMAAKYGNYEENHLDSGIYFEDGEAAYSVVVMGRELGFLDYFMGDLNRQLRNYHEAQIGRRN